MTQLSVPPGKVRALVDILHRDAGWKENLASERVGIAAHLQRNLNRTKGHVSVLYEVMLEEIKLFEDILNLLSEPPSSSNALSTDEADRWRNPAEVEWAVTEAKERIKAKREILQFVYESMCERVESLCIQHQIQMEEMKEDCNRWGKDTGNYALAMSYFRAIAKFSEGAGPASEGEFEDKDDDENGMCQCQGSESVRCSPAYRQLLAQTLNSGTETPEWRR